jgi:hypothetical protein
MSRRHHDIPPLTPLLPSSTCPVCGESMLLCQPDPSSPERLVSVCTDCGAWFLISNWGMLRLPLEDESWDVAKSGDIRDFITPSRN